MLRKNYLSSLPAFVREWVLFECEAVPVLQYGLSSVACMVTTLAPVGPVEFPGGIESLGAGFDCHVPMFLLNYERDGFALGWAFQATHEFIPGSVGRCTEERFSFDSTRGSVVLVYSLLFDSDYIALHVMAPCGHGNVDTLITVCKRYNGIEKRMSLVCRDLRDCMNCGFKDEFCKCQDEEKAAAMSDVSAGLENLQLSTGGERPWDVFTGTGFKLLSGNFQMHISGVHHDINTPFQIEASIKVSFVNEGPMVLRMQKRYAQQLLERTNPHFRPFTEDSTIGSSESDQWGTSSARSSTNIAASIRKAIHTSQAEFKQRSMTAAALPSTQESLQTSMHWSKIGSGSGSGSGPGSHERVAAGDDYGFDVASIPSVPSPEDGSSTCRQCGASFKRIYELRRHIVSVHEGVKKHVCNQCGKEFYQLSHLKNHVKGVHKKLRNVQCTMCPKSFTTNDKMQRHVRSVHLMQRNCVCEACGKAYFQNNDLRKHVLKCPKIHGASGPPRTAAVADQGS